MGENSTGVVVTVVVLGALGLGGWFLFARSPALPPIPPAAHSAGPTGEVTVLTLSVAGMT